MKRAGMVWIVVFALLIALVAIACGDDDSNKAATAAAGGTTAGGGSAPAALDTKNPFRIAAVFDKTGPTAGDTLGGAAGLAGMNAAVKYVNEHGGILGRQVVVDVEDGASDTAKALDAGTRLILSGKYQVMIANSSGSPSLAVYANSKKVVTFTANGDPRMQDPKQLPYIFDNSDQPNHQGLASVCYVKTLPYKKYAILAQDYPYSKVISAGWQSELPKFGIQITGQELVQFGQLDMTTQLLKLKQGNPDAILDMVAGPDFGHVVDGMKNLNWNIPIVGESAMSSTNFVTALKSLSDIPQGSTMSAWGINVLLQSGPTESQKRIIAALKEQGLKSLDNPMYNYVYGWDPIFLIKYGAEKAKSDQADGIKQGLETIDTVKDQTSLLTALVPHHSYRPDWHGLLNDKFYGVKPGKIADGMYEWSANYTFTGNAQSPCQ